MDLTIFIATIVSFAPALASIVAAIINFAKNNAIVGKAMEATKTAINDGTTCTNAALHELANSVNELSQANKVLQAQLTSVMQENARLKSLLLEIYSDRDHIAYSSLEEVPHE